MRVTPRHQLVILIASVLGAGLLVYASLARFAGTPAELDRFERGPGATSAAPNFVPKAAGANERESIPEGAAGSESASADAGAQRIETLFELLENGHPTTPDLVSPLMGEFDLSLFQQYVLESGVSVGDLRRELESQANRKKRPALVLALAFASDPEGSRPEVLVEMSAALMDGHSSQEDLLESVTAVHAIRLSGNAELLARTGEQLLERGSQLALFSPTGALDGFRETAIHCALKGLAAFKGEHGVSATVVDALLNAALSDGPFRISNVGRSAWQLAAAEGDAEWIARGLTSASSGNGLARPVLECIEEPRYLPDLISTIESASESIYARCSAASAMSGLISIGTGSSLQALKQCLDDPILRADALEVIAGNQSLLTASTSHPRALLELVSMSDEDGQVALTVRAKVEALARAAARTPASSPGRDRMRGELRAAIEGADRGSTAYLMAIDALAICGHSKDRDLLLEAASGLEVSEETLARITGL